MQLQCCSCNVAGAFTVKIIQKHQCGGNAKTSDVVITQKHPVTSLVIRRLRCGANVVIRCIHRGDFHCGKFCRPPRRHRLKHCCSPSPLDDRALTPRLARADRPNLQACALQNARGLTSACERRGGGVHRRKRDSLAGATSPHFINIIEEESYAA